MFFEYGNRETDYLRRRDKRLGAAMDRIGPIHRRVDPDLFSSVVHHIIGQQISTAAQTTIWNRLLARIGNVNSETLCALDASELQSLGMTHKKAGYILHFAELVLRKEFDIEAQPALPDKTVITQLSSLKGIGVWTAEMILLFCMQRSDVLSYGDLAIHRGLCMLYHHKHIDRERFSKYATRYAPYGSVASLYLWAIAGGALPDLRDGALGTSGGRSRK